MVSAPSFSASKMLHQVVGDLAHDEAVEQRHPVPGAGTGENAPAGQKAESVEQAVKAFGPLLALPVFRRRNRLRHPPPAGTDVGLARRAVAGLPDMTGDFHTEGVG